MLYKKLAKIFFSILLISTTIIGCSNQASQGNSANSTTSEKSMEKTMKTSTSDKQANRDYWPTQDWRTSTPGEQGIDSTVLTNLDKEINDLYPQIHSFLIVRHGYLVFEKYYRQYTKDSLNDLQSATKSITSSLIGIAIKEGYIKSIDEKLIDFFPEYVNKNNQKGLSNITIKHLLTMTSGFNLSSDWYTSKNWIQYLFSLGTDSQPGEEFIYDNLACHSLSGVLRKTTKMTELDFAKKFLFQPLGTTSCKWNTDPQGNNIGAGELSLKARDAAKFGYLYINEGNWDNKEVISKEWIKDSTTVQNEGGSPHNEKYGYLFWITKVNGYNAYFAGGFGGQFIYVIPDLDIVVTITSDIDQHHEENRDLISKYVIPSVIK